MQQAAQAVGKRLCTVARAALACALALALVVAFAPPFSGLAQAAGTTASGEVGTCTWTLAADGTLTIAPTSGTSGTLASEEHPWTDYATSIQKVVVEGTVVLPQSVDSLFKDCSNLAEIEGIENFDTSATTRMSYMFYGCSSLTSLDLSSWDTSELVYMGYMFYCCSSLESIDFSGWVTSVGYFVYTFYGCSALKSLDMANWDTSDVYRLDHTFKYCSSLESLDVTGWDTSYCIDFGGMLNGCGKLSYLDLSSWSTANVQYMGRMFTDCTGLRTVKLGAGFGYASDGGYLCLPVDDDYGEGWWVDGNGKAYTDTTKIPAYTAATYTAAFDTNTDVSKATVTLNTSKMTYTGKKLKCGVKAVKIGSKKLVAGTQYTVSYSNNKKIGTATVKVKGKGIYSGTVTKTFTILPKKVSLKSAKSAARAKATVKWGKVAGGVSYQVYYRVKGGKWAHVNTGSSASSKTISKLKSGKTYQVRVRAYKKVSGKNYYGSWSATKTVKVK